MWQGVSGHVCYWWIWWKLQHHDDILLHLVLEHEWTLWKETLLSRREKRGSVEKDGGVWWRERSSSSNRKRKGKEQEVKKWRKWKEVWTDERKNGKRQLVWRLEEKTRYTHRGELHELTPVWTVQSNKGTGQTRVRHGKLEWSRLYIWDDAYMIYVYQKDSVWSTKKKHKKLLQLFCFWKCASFRTLKFNSTFTCSRSKSNGREWSWQCSELWARFSSYLIPDSGGFWQKWTEVDENIHISCKSLKNELKGLKWTYLTKFLVRREKQREPCGDNEG